MLGPFGDVRGPAPIRMRIVTQVKTPWRHRNDASTDVSNPRHMQLTSASIRTRQMAPAGEEMDSGLQIGPPSFYELEI
jgi:hypothetical protein